MIIKFMIGILVLLLAALAFAFYARKFNNPYKLYMYIGKKGSGKTTIADKKTFECLKAGRDVYSNIPTNVPEEYHDKFHLIDPKRIGNPFVFPRGSVIMVDECGMIWDNRNFKNFNESVRDYFKLQRQYGNIVYLFSQDFDIDLKIRKLVDRMYLVEKKMNVFVFARRIDRKLVVVDPEGETEGRIADGLILTPLWMQLFGAGAVQFAYIPKWCKVFNTNYAADAAKKPFYPVARNMNPDV